MRSMMVADLYNLVPIDLSKENIYRSYARNVRLYYPISAVHHFVFISAVDVQMVIGPTPTLLLYIDPTLAGKRVRTKVYF